MSSYSKSQTQNSGSSGEAITGAKTFTITNSKGPTNTYSVGYFTLDGNSTSNQNLLSDAPMAGTFSDFTGGANPNSLIQTNTRFSISIHGSGGSFIFTPSTPIPANSYYVKGVGEFNIEISPISSPSLLDDITGQTGAFSLRKVNSSYNGNALQVRRASDNTTQDIGFTNNELDVNSINSFCSGTDGFVSIWYNQINTNNNAIQSASSVQPKIYDSITGVELENGKPAINFLYTNFLEVLDVNSYNIEQAISSYTVFSTPLTGNNSYPMIWSKSYSQEGSITLSLFANTGKVKFFIDRIGVGAQPSFNDVRGNQMIVANFNGVSDRIISQNSSLHTSTNYADLLGTNSTKFTIGRTYQGTYYFTGKIQEIILFNNNQYANRTTLETNINNFYSVY